MGAPGGDDDAVPRPRRSRDRPVTSQTRFIVAGRQPPLAAPRVTRSPFDTSLLERQVRATLAKRHRVSPDDVLAIGSFNAFVFFGKLQTLFLVLSRVSWVVGGATLLAGVVGVSNIMLITVKERTKEVGVRKALGATPVSIVAMVMKESVVLTVIAGLLGVAAGTGLIALAGTLLENAPDSPMGPPVISLQPVMIAVGILIAAGGVAGIMPAAHAASIKPIEALRTE
jgi:putative ABC transport system permease protein